MVAVPAGRVFAFLGDSVLGGGFWAGAEDSTPIDTRKRKTATRRRGNRRAWFDVLKPRSDAMFIEPPILLKQSSFFRGEIVLAPINRLPESVAGNMSINISSLRDGKTMQAL
jgi:hypothetical protein